MYRIGICDNDEILGLQLENYIQEYCQHHGQKADTLIFLTPGELFDSIEKDGPFDLLFLDIELKGITGIDVGKILRKALSNEITQIVYISSKTDYTMKLFETHPLYFLIKPVKPEDITHVMNTCDRLFLHNDTYFEYKAGKKMCRVNQRHIMYLQSAGKTIHMYTTFGSNVFYGKLSNALKQLNENLFYSVHRSYIINWNYVAAYHIENLVLSDKTVIPISQSKRKTVRKQILKNTIANN